MENMTSSWTWGTTTTTPVVLEEDLLHQLLVDAPPAVVALLVPAMAIYLSLYALARGWTWTGRALAVPTLLLFWAGIELAPVRCLALRGVFDFGSEYGTIHAD